MLRVAAWTGGLFAIGAGVAHYFPGNWTEPLVLAALGASMLILGGRSTPASAATKSSPANSSQQIVTPAPRPARVAR